MTKGAKECELILEQMIDEQGAARVIAFLQQVMLEKAEHVQTNWQDKTTAHFWSRTASLLQSAYNYALDVEFANELPSIPSEFETFKDADDWMKANGYMPVGQDGMLGHFYKRPGRGAGLRLRLAGNMNGKYEARYA